jgi:hypothetical protein
VAAAVVAAMQAEVGGVELQRPHVWLVQPPAGAGVHPKLWGVVCLAAVAAMTHGCRRLHGLRARDAQGGPVGWTVAGVGAFAVMRFWDYLEDFASAPGLFGFKSPGPGGGVCGVPGVGAAHPFLRPRDDGVGWEVHRRGQQPQQQ